MSAVLKLLDEIRHRPLAIYVGEVSLTKLAAYLRGYDHGARSFSPEKADSFLMGFRDWIQRRFKANHKSWEEIILFHSLDEAEAVKLFWELLDKFLAENPGYPPEQTSASGNGSATWQERNAQKSTNDQGVR